MKPRSIGTQTATSVGPLMLLQSHQDDNRSTLLQRAILSISLGSPLRKSQEAGSVGAQWLPICTRVLARISPSQVVHHQYPQSSLAHLSNRSSHGGGQSSAWKRRNGHLLRVTLRSRDQDQLRQRTPTHQHQRTPSDLCRYLKITSRLHQPNLAVQHPRVLIQRPKHSRLHQHLQQITYLTLKHYLRKSDPSSCNGVMWRKVSLNWKRLRKLHQLM